MSKKKIFITGVAGFLGSHLADIFLAEGHEVIGCDNLIGGYLDNVPEGVILHKADCRNFDQMNKLLEGIDIVYHTAALAYEGLSVFSPSLITEHIVISTVTVISAAIQNKVERFIYCSSMARYGTQKTVPFTEDMIPKPQDPYGIGKVAGEQFLRNLAETHGMEYVIAVPHNIIGARQKYDDPYRNVASIMINMMLQGHPPVIYGDGNQKRCFSFIDDDTRILKEFAFRKDVSGEIFNIGPDDEFVSINELSEIIMDLLGVKLNPIYLKKRPQEVTLANCSSNKIREWFDYKTTVTLREGLQTMIEYIERKGVKQFSYNIELEITNEKTPIAWTEELFNKV